MRKVIVNGALMGTLPILCNINVTQWQFWIVCLVCCGIILNSQID